MGGSIGSTPTSEWWSNDMRRRTMRWAATQTDLSITSVPLSRARTQELAGVTQEQGMLREFRKWTPDQLRTSIQSFRKLIAKHEQLLDNPTIKVNDWNTLSPQHQQNILHHWRKDTERARELIEIAESVLGGM